MKARKLFACLLATSAMAPPVHAQDASAEAAEGHDEIVVTAERRGQNIQKTPISVVALSGGDLKERAIEDIETLTAQVPSLSYTDNGNTKYFNVRGVGISESAPNQTVGVAVHWDGTYVAREFVFGDAFFDVASVEVLRGPQGTYTGQNASGGALFINSVRPDFKGLSGFAEATAGNFDRKKLGAGVNFQLSDTLAARISGEFERQDSSFTNLGATGTRTEAKAASQPGNLSRFIGRAQLLFRPSDDLDLLLIHQVSDRQTDNLPYQRFDVGSVDRRVIAYDADTRLDVRYNRTTAVMNYNGLDAFAVRLAGTYQTTRQNLAGDDDMTTAALYPALARGSTSIRLRDRYYTGEINLISPSTQPLTWTVGATFLDYKQPGVISNTAGLYIFVTSRRRNEAVFGEAGYKLTDTLEVKLGGRYNWDHAGFDNDGYLAIGGTRLANFTPGIVDFGEFTGRAVINWQATPDHFLYGSISKGYKPGGTTPQSLRYGSERVINYEAGWKGSFLDRAITTSLSAFYMDYEAYQATFTPDINNPTSAITRNVDGTKIKGIEGQAALNLDAAHVDLSFSVLDATYGNLLVVQPAGLFGPGNPAGPTTVNLDGRTIPFAAKFSGGAGISYDVSLAGGTLTPSMRVTHTAGQWVNFFQAAYNRIPARTLLNARIGFKSNDRWSLAAYANNLLDKDYIANVQQVTDGVGAFLLGSPREWGATLGYSF